MYNHQALLNQAHELAYEPPRARAVAVQQLGCGQQLPPNAQSSSSGSSAGSRGGATQGESEQQGKVVLYRGLGMVPFRVLVRLKIFQLAGVAALAIPINTFLAEVSASMCPSS